MKFGEKVREERMKKELTQQELANLIGVSLRTITNYEVGAIYPKKREVYAKLAEVLEVNVNYLLTENEEFVADAQDKYGTRGAKQAQELVEKLGGMFAGGELSESDMDAVMLSMQKLYWDAKEENKKYTPNKYRKDK